jgi:hypothetical protein
MRTAKNLARAAGLLGLAGALLLSGGCGRQPVSARTQPPKVLKWKHQPAHDRGIPKGIVVEHRGREIRARYCDLKSGSGFVEHSTLAHGTYVSDGKAIIFPLGKPDAVDAHEWVQAGGPHLRVAFDADAMRLAGDLAATGDQHSFHFVRHHE